MKNVEPQVNCDADAPSKRPKLDRIYTETMQIGNAPVDKEHLDQIVAFTKKNRGRALSSDEQIDILLLQGFLRYEHIKNQKKNGPRRPIKAPQVSKRISKILRRKEQLVKETWRECVQNSTITTRMVPGNRNAKDGVILNC